MIKLLASDLDGTLLRSDGSVGERTRAAIQAATTAGLLVVFVTGRPPRWLIEVGDATEHTGVAVAANGAVIYDLATESVTRAYPLSPDELGALTSDLRAAFPDVRFAVEYGLDFGYEPGYRHDWEISPSQDRQGNPLPAPLVGSLAEIISRPGVKLLAKDREADADEFMTQAATLLADRATVTRSSRNGLLEIAAAGITKASGLAEVAAEAGISADEVAAVGDMPNDLPMLGWAGRAYAVGNAHHTVQDVADEVLAHHDDEPVAELLEKLTAQLS
jgi:Cof subfamily protein (haloacid dehalogenase superfamily)